MARLNLFIFARNWMLVLFIGWLIVSPVPNPNRTSNQQPSETIYKVSGGGQDEPKSSTSQLKSVPEIKSVSQNSKTSLEPKEFREMLARYFPDWDARLSVEKQQAIIYNKATKKLKAYKNFNPLLKNPEKLLTDDEKFAIDYFHGRGTCEKFQDPKTRPNLYDSRQTFLPDPDRILLK